MSNSTATAIKAYLEGAGVGVPVLPGYLRQTAQYPCVTVDEQIGLTSDPTFNQFDDSRGHVTELVQVDVWQHRWNPQNLREVIEDYTLPDTVLRLLKGAGLSTAPTRVFGVRVLDSRRLPYEVVPSKKPGVAPTVANVVHHTITVEVRRTLERI